jgi:uncharacterized RDD family membrane protein YckC
MSRKKNSNRSAPKPAPAVPVNPYAGLPRAGLFRRLGAWACDAVLVLALTLIAGALGFGLAFVSLKLGLAKLGDYPDTATWLAHNLLHTLYLACVICGFYLWGWCRTGQTPGLKLLGLRVQNRDGSHLKVAQALVRMFTSAFGLGNLLILFDNNKLTFQDHWADCEVVILPAQEK